MNHTELPWEANKFTKLDGSQIRTVDDVIECLKISATLSSGVELYGVSLKNDEKNICYTGNGKTSKENALFIAKACNCHEELLEALEDITSYEYRSERVICQAPNIPKCMCNKCIDERVKQAIAKAQEK